MIDMEDTVPVALILSHSDVEDAVHIFSADNIFGFHATPPHSPHSPQDHPCPRSPSHAASRNNVSPVRVSRAVSGGKSVAGKR